MATNIRDMLEANANADGVALEFTYTEVADPALGGAPGGSVGIRYVMNGNGYMAAISTRYTQTEQPYVKVAGDHMTGELSNDTRFNGGFAIEDRNLIGG